MKKRLRKLLLVAAVLIALPLLYLVEERVRGEWQLASYKGELLARGEKLTIEELIPPVPEGTNVVLLSPDAAQSLLAVGYALGDESPLIARTLSSGRAVISSERDRWYGMDGESHTWDGYLEAAKATRERLPELRSRLTNSVLRLKVNYDGDLAVLMPYRTPFKVASQALCQV